MLGRLNEKSPSFHRDTDGRVMLPGAQLIAIVLLIIFLHYSSANVAACAKSTEPAHPFDAAVRKANNDYTNGNYQAAADESTKVIKQLDASDKNSTHLILPLYLLSEACSELGRLTDAEDAARRAVKIAEVRIADSSPQHLLQLKGMAYEILGQFLVDQGRGTEARPSLEKAIKLFGTDDKHALSPLSSLASMYYNQGKFQQAESLYERIISTARKCDSQEELGVALRDLACCYKFQHKYKESEHTFNEVLDLLRKSNRTTDDFYGVVYSELGSLYQDQKRFKEAESAFRTNLDLLIKKRVPEKELVGALYDLGNLYVVMGRLADAEPLLNRAYGARADKSQVIDNVFLDKVFSLQRVTATDVHNKCFAGRADLQKELASMQGRVDQNSIQYARFLEDLAFAYPCFPIKNQPLIPLVIKAIKIREQLEGPNNPKIADDKFLIANRLASLGGTFTPIALEAFGTWNMLYYKRDPTLKFWVPSMVRVGSLLACDASTKSHARQLGIIALTYYDPSAPKAGPDVYSLGHLFELLGEYGSARTAYEYGYEWCEKNKSGIGAKSGLPFQAAGIARVCYLQGDLNNAWEKVKTAEACCTAEWGPDYFQKHPEGMKCLELVTAIARARGDFATAEACARKLTSLPVLGRPPSEMPRHFLELSQILVSQKKYAEAKKHATFVVGNLSNYMNKGFNEKVELAKAHALLGKIALSEGSYSLADTEFRQSWNFNRSDKSTEGLLNTVTDLNALSFLSYKLGRPDNATETVLNACQQIDRYIADAFAGLSFSEQCEFSSFVTDQIDPLLSLGLTDRTAAECFKYIIHWQGLLINAVSNRSWIESRNNPATVARLKQVRSDVAQLTSGVRGNDADSLSNTLKQKIEEKEMLERRIATTAIGRMSDTASLIDAKSFPEFALAPDEGLVDIVEYKNLLTMNSEYVAFTISKGGNVKALKLGDANEIDQLSGKWLKAMESKTGTTRDCMIEQPPESSEIPTVFVDDIQASVAKSLWLPIKSTLPPAVTKVWICPDGQLSTIPWSVLAESSESKSIPLCQIDSPRALLNLKSRLKFESSAPPLPLNLSSLLLVGGINFAAGIPSLPGTKREVETISKLAKDSFLTTELMGDAPTKYELLDRLGKANIAHLATHGFFEHGEAADSKASHTTVVDALTRSQPDFTSVSTESGKTERVVTLTSRNPLLTSGLLVAPKKMESADELKKPQSLEPLTLSGKDDRLTAEDLVSENLQRLNLVVLSACNTGRGKCYQGQGVMGLRAALTGAGAKGVLMSLWPVDDDATKELMTHFYENLWSKDHPMKPVEALRVAQQSVRSTPGGKWRHPFFWAGWVFDGIGW